MCVYARYVDMPAKGSKRPVECSQASTWLPLVSFAENVFCCRRSDA
jgi:hypothetical protein